MELLHATGFEIGNSTALPKETRPKGVQELRESVDNDQMGDIG